MEYFGSNTIEQSILDFLDQIKQTHGLNNQQLNAKTNKVIEYYRESLMYNFDESEYPSTLEMMRNDSMIKREDES